MHQQENQGKAVYIGVVGLNHKLANVALRELFANACTKLFGLNPFFPCVLLSTCNRTEIYFSSDTPHAKHGHILHLLREELTFEFEHLLYSYFDADCFAHLARVSSGLDSAVAAETAIQGQVKEAYRESAQKHALSYELHYLFQKASQISKEVRQSLSLLSGCPAIEQAILQVGKAYFKTFQEVNLLLVGASNVNHAILQCLKNKKLASITLCNRTPKTWESCQKLSWSQLESWHEYDWVITATKSPSYVINPPPYLSEAKRSLLMDLSIPANIDKRLSNHAGITLMNIDDVNKTLAYSHKQYRCILSEAEQHVEQAARKKLQSFKNRYCQAYDERQ